MIRRDHLAGGVASQAVYSACGLYRHALHRRWGAGPVLGWVMLNPSTATEAQDDPTIARCVARARALGFGGIAVGNLFALRATNPQALRRTPDPIGEGSDAALLAAMQDAAQIVCAWGNHGALNERAGQVLALLRATGLPMTHLGLTAQGQPRHPLYVAAKAPLIPLA
jgi:hypothetical protein